MDKGAKFLSPSDTPPPAYDRAPSYKAMIQDRDVMVPMRDGVRICVDVYRPDAKERFPALLAFAVHNKEMQTPEIFSDPVAKSVPNPADQLRERQILIQNLQSQAAKLRLQTIIMGSTEAGPKAIVEGQLVQEGDVVASFRVLKIESRRIVVEREGIKLEIAMK